MGDSHREPRIDRNFDVRGLRRRLGLSQAELAKEIGSTERSIRRWEKRNKGETERFKGSRPQRYFVLKMKELEALKFGSTTPERSAVPAPVAKSARHIATEPGIGIAPGSL